jgi:predicted membrane-bound spermidine synthase
LRMTDLVLANSIQLATHALVMLWLAHRLGSLRRRGLAPTALKSLLAATVMGGLTAFSAGLLFARFPGVTLSEQVIVVAGAALVGVVVYAALSVALGIEEIHSLLALLRRPFARLLG